MTTTKAPTPNYWRHVLAWIILCLFIFAVMKYCTSCTFNHYLDDSSFKGCDTVYMAGGGVYEIKQTEQ